MPPQAAVEATPGRFISFRVPKGRSGDRRPPSWRRLAGPPVQPSGLCTLTERNPSSIPTQGDRGLCAQMDRGWIWGGGGRVPLSRDLRGSLAGGTVLPASALEVSPEVGPVRPSCCCFCGAGSEARLSPQPLDTVWVPGLVHGAPIRLRLLADL